MTDATSITALLGPTNTGKTHRAVERMLDHDSGMIGLPLRLLAREVYDRVTARVGEARVALVTGEEKRVPRRPDYWVCTVEAMPVAREVDFVAVDEVQLAAHPQRGHVFTERLLHARGRRETMFLGSDSMRSMIEQLAPAAKLVGHPRLSRLLHAEPVPLQRLPKRSAVVAFSLPQVYELAERLRVAKGGAAVVLGALSPRTRNAQVAMFQAGEVDYLVATDAIGMGLNLDVRHVSFASLRKFDGREVRDLDVAELAQIAGRAGRYVQDGTFGAISPLAMPRDLVDAIENHRVAPVRRVQWRRHDLEFGSLAALAASLREAPPRRVLVRATHAEDEAALAALAARDDVRARLRDASQVRLLWDVCTVPDFRRLLFEAHVATLGDLFVALADRGALGDAWLAERVAPLDDADGDVDTLIARIAAVRTWTYVVNQPAWVEHAAAWQDRTRALEDRLSDALHERLVRRFVDQPANPRDVQSRPRARHVHRPAEVEVPASHPFAGLRAMRDALASRHAAPVVTGQQRVEELVDAPHERFALDARGRVLDGDAELARLVAGASITLPGVELLGLEGVGAGLRSRLQRRLVAWTRDVVHELLAPLRELKSLSASARGVLYHLELGLGTTLTRDVKELLVDLSADEREAFAQRGVHLGGRVCFARSLLKPPAVARRAVIAAVHHGMERRFAAPPAGAVTLRPDREAPASIYLAVGYPLFGARAVRADIAERVHAAMTAAEPPAEGAVAQWLGLPQREAAALAARIVGGAVAPEGPPRG